MLTEQQKKRSDNDDHVKRVRFNASSITVKDSQTGTDFKDVIELYGVYISEFDFFDENRTIYHTEKVLRETGKVIDDGLHEIYVDTAVDDGTDVADLMSCFTKKEVKSEKFPALSNEVKRLKETEGGVQVMCEVMQKYERLAVQQNNINKIKKMIQKGYAKEEIMDLDFTEEEYAEAEAELLQPVS